MRRDGGASGGRLYVRVLGAGTDMHVPGLMGLERVKEQNIHFQLL